MSNTITVPVIPIAKVGNPFPGIPSLGTIQFNRFSKNQIRIWSSQYSPASPIIFDFNTLQTTYMNSFINQYINGFNGNASSFSVGNMPDKNTFGTFWGSGEGLFGKRYVNASSYYTLDESNNVIAYSFTHIKNGSNFRSLGGSELENFNVMFGKYDNYIVTTSNILNTNNNSLIYQSAKNYIKTPVTFEMMTNVNNQMNQYGAYYKANSGFNKYAVYPSAIIQNYCFAKYLTAVAYNKLCDFVYNPINFTQTGISISGIGGGLIAGLTKLVVYTEGLANLTGESIFGNGLIYNYRLSQSNYLNSLTPLIQYTNQYMNIDSSYSENSFSIAYTPGINNLGNQSNPLFNTPHWCLRAPHGGEVIMIPGGYTNPRVPGGYYLINQNGAPQLSAPVFMSIGAAGEPGLFAFDSNNQLWYCRVAWADGFPAFVRNYSTPITA